MYVPNTSFLNPCPCLLPIVIQHSSHVSTTSIKLCSLTSQRRMRTFTCTTLTLFGLSSRQSTHPSLEKMVYSGDKSGFVARVDVEGCAHVSESRCALICHDVELPAQGVNQVVLDDTVVWTASGSLGPRRWHARSQMAGPVAASVESPTSVTSRTMSLVRPSRSIDRRPRPITFDLPPSPLLR